MIRIVLWSFLCGLLTTVMLKKELLEAYDFLLYGGVIFMVIFYIVEFMEDHDIKVTLRNLW